MASLTRPTLSEDRAGSLHVRIPSAQGSRTAEDICSSTHAKSGPDPRGTLRQKSGKCMGGPYVFSICRGVVFL